MLREADAQYPPERFTRSGDENTNVVSFMLKGGTVPAKSGIIDAISERRLPGKQAKGQRWHGGKPFRLLYWRPQPPRLRVPNKLARDAVISVNINLKGI